MYYLRVKKIIIPIIIFIPLAIWLNRYFTIDFLKQNTDLLMAYFQQNKILFSVLYFFTYIFITATFIPGGPLIMTLLGGFLFGNTFGLLLVSFASSIGATLAFLVSRYFFADYFKKKFAKLYKKINQGIENGEKLYLLSLRLTPLVPFILVNLVCGLTKIKAFTFYLISQIGMLPITALIVNAGTQLSTIKSPEEIFSPKIVISLTLVAIFPLIVRRLINNP